MPIYIDLLMRAGLIVDKAQAQHFVTHEMQQLLPHHTKTQGQHLLFVEDNRKQVGLCWLSERSLGRPDLPRAWLHYIDIYPPYRRQGYGTQVLSLCEAFLAQRDIHEMALNVFAFNQEAKRLYARAGYNVYKTVHETQSPYAPVRFEMSKSF